MDPFTVLDVDAGATPEELAAAYRRAAKRWHPDLAGEAGVRRMADINAAYDVLRSGAWQQQVARTAAPMAVAEAERLGETVIRGSRRRRVHRAAGSWLSEAVRRALGPELLPALEPAEDVRLVTPVSVWASPQALLAVTDRRLLWLLDDAVTGRVRMLGFDAITGVETRLAWPRKRHAVLRVHRRSGRPLAFSELRPETAETIAGHLRQGVAP